MLNTSKLLEVLGNTWNYKGNPADEIKLEEQNQKVEQNEVIIDTSSSKQIPEVEESKWYNLDSLFVSQGFSFGSKVFYLCKWSIAVMS